MLLWNTETDTSGESGPADTLDSKSVGSEISLTAFVTGTKGAKFYTSLTDVIKQMESSIVLVDNSMQAIVNQMGHASETLADNIRKSFADASLEILQLGGTEKEALAIQTQTLEVLGRNVTLSKDQYTTLFATSKVTGQSTKELEEAFLNIGGNIDQIATDMESVLHISNNLGVNAKAVSEKVVENMQQLNRVGFQGGVEGLARMAAKAQVLRTDMSEVFELADDLMSPEKAIELASALQRLGATSTSLIDPLRLMDLAQNDVGELQNQLGEMFKTYTYFDEKTKKFQIMPSARRDLKQLSSELGIPLDQIEKMALGSADLDKKLSEIDFSGLDVDEDTKTMIANMATMNKEGKYVIKNEQGVDQELSSFIQSYSNNTEGLKSFLDQKTVDESKSAEQKMIEKADQQLSHLKRIEALNESAAKSLALSAARGAYGKNLLLANEEIAKLSNQPIIDRGGAEGDAAKGFQEAADKFAAAVDKMKAGDVKGGMTELGRAGKNVITGVGGTAVDILKDYGNTLGINAASITALATKISNGLTDALSKFENPGTLKVTIYGDKTGNPKKIEDAVSNPKDIENENTENMSKLFDVSLSQLEQTGILVKLFERVGQILENIGQNDGISVRELVQKDKSIETKTIDKESLTEVNTIVSDTLKNTFSEFEKTKQILIESGISVKEIMSLQEKFIQENYVTSEKGVAGRETGEQVSVENMVKSFNNYLIDYSKKTTFNQNNTENINDENNPTSVKTFLNQKTQSTPSQTNPEVIQLLSQTNESVRQSLNKLEVSNQDTILNTETLNNAILDKKTVEQQTSDTLSSVVDTVVNNENNNLEIQNRERETFIPYKLPIDERKPQFIKPNFTNFIPPDFAKVENYMKNFEEKTYNENKTEKKEQKVDFGPLKIQFDVTGFPQNNPQATDALLDIIKRDRRFGLAFENMLKGINFGLLEKIK